MVNFLNQFCSGVPGLNKNPDMIYLFIVVNLQPNYRTVYIGSSIAYLKNCSNTGLKYNKHVYFTCSKFTMSIIIYKKHNSFPVTSLGWPAFQNTTPYQQASIYVTKTKGDRFSYMRYTIFFRITLGFFSFLPLPIPVFSCSGNSISETLLINLTSSSPSDEIELSGH